MSISSINEPQPVGEDVEDVDERTPALPQQLVGRARVEPEPAGEQRRDLAPGVRVGQRRGRCADRIRGR
ncbi:hypothetical protein ACFO4E_11290 [Nocardiopsis mangrovi]|uniref:Uncharacterized protein n=1 Tax=Nocardiopsis mangrovi TaxID=1179818 RepID=A0ABV9DVK2_9ACTN